jgi:hypothetical protein
MEIDKIAEELAESWINGNKSWVAEQLADKSPLAAATCAALMMAQMGERECESFISYLRLKV